MNTARGLFHRASEALLVAVLFSFSGCISNPNIDTSMPQDSSKFADCLATGASCGGDRICCPGEICKGGRCSGDATCTGPGGMCNSSADCCGLSTCSNGHCGFGTGGCFTTGQACQGGADCCGTLTCQNGSCH